ncbi:alpha/beta-hydrolase [Ascobolus immersus RN42]|uniref:Carboxylic ester hydrolase n=1 Tax=Ascobolus immersus RN42 TaxID=1160509 RepID=A0A3N4IBT0_ASCIM|nr:alpha/beta-hydrolase [Ascobolus immersus RN42]
MQFKLTVVALLGSSALASAAQLAQYTNWGANPGNLPRVDIYVPDRLAANPAVVLGLHPCGGNGQQFYGQTRLPSYADRHGFIMIFPTSKTQTQGMQMNCWDVHSSASLRRDGGGESQSLANIVKSVLTKYNGDASKVYVIGTSSGAMMTNNMAALYPDLFNAGTAVSGIPAGCFTGASSSNPGSPDQTCANGQKNYSKQQWGDLARSLYPGYTGKRTRMQIIHGTADSLTVFKNYQATLDQWSNIMGLSQTSNSPNTPISSWTENKYGDGTQLVGYAVQGGGHIPALNEDAIINFWQITATGNPTLTVPGPTSTATTQPPVTPTFTPTPTPTPTDAGPRVPKWGQCAGNGYNGPTVCETGSRCVKLNDWYSQCQ